MEWPIPLQDAGPGKIACRHIMAYHGGVGVADGTAQQPGEVRLLYSVGSVLHECELTHATMSEFLLCPQLHPATQRQHLIFYCASKARSQRFSSSGSMCLNINRFKNAWLASHRFSQKEFGPRMQLRHPTFLSAFTLATWCQSALGRHHQQGLRSRSPCGCALRSPAVPTASCSATTSHSATERAMFSGKTELHPYLREDACPDSAVQLLWTIRCQLQV